MILSQHGHTLKKFNVCPSESVFNWVERHIPMVFTKDHILQIQAQCPALQELAITVKRTKSDVHEAEMLARSIWDIICRDKAGKRLESHILYTTSGGDFGDPSHFNDADSVFEKLSHLWLIERGVRDDEGNINERELGRRASREACDKELTDPGPLWLGLPRVVRSSR